MDPEAKRVRAWVFFNATDAREAARKIAVHFPEGGDDWIIVRADVVQGDYNLVVPVDAANEPAFDEAMGILRGAAGPEKSVARVVDHHPLPAHKAHCYLTPGELRGAPDPAFPSPGRHPKSPGGNAWG